MYLPNNNIVGIFYIFVNKKSIFLYKYNKNVKTMKFKKIKIIYCLHHYPQ